MRARLDLLQLMSALALAAAPAGGAAQTVPSPFRFVESGMEAGAFVGRASIAQGRFSYGPSGGVTAGGRWSIDFNGPLGFEVAAGVISGGRDVINPARAEGDRKVGEADVLLGTADARLRFSLTGDRTWNRIAPFIVAGGGLAFDLAGKDPADDLLTAENRFDFGTTFLGTMGLGSKYFVSEGFVLRGDATFSLWKIDTPPGFSDPDLGIEAVEESEWVRGLLFTVAAAIRF
jgi:hypothetical protein